MHLYSKASSHARSQIYMVEIQRRLISIGFPGSHQGSIEHFTCIVKIVITANISGVLTTEVTWVSTSSIYQCSGLSSLETNAKQMFKM
ncbi:unnamed protein product [Allacma fusca]|uniref:Uncharacterized protein n=1 Tax=Allacma fusca TaxID=39272 RepID=A0A8J2M8F3_9HEXA|nr:unnamed protein product [Allacma fusca]